MDDPKAKLLTRIRESTNVLVTVSSNPSLDQLSGAIGLTLLLNKLGKHATAVFSGEVPSIIEYLKPEETIEKTTDSLRDFIIALDKSKADKLRYKVEDKMVKIFITPYRTSISENDLEFSQGDFNVDVVIAVGVHQQKDLDQAITSHGRILHDATVSSINNQANGNLGSINWVDGKASSLCEMLYSLCQELKPDALDAQMATSFLTGIVSETKRFANEKTTARSMAISSQLVAAGANQQLVAAKLQESTPEPPAPKKEEKPAPLPPEPEEPEKIFKPAPKVKEEKADAGTLQVAHEEEPEEQELEEIKIDEHGVLYRPSEDQLEEKKPELAPEKPEDEKDEKKGSSRIVLEPPTLGGKLTANSEPEHLDPAVDPLGATKTDQPLLSHDSKAAEPDEIPTLPMPDPSTIPVAPDTTTLEEIEKSVDSPHQDDAPEPQQPEAPAAGGTPDLDAARDAVLNAVNSSTDLSPPPPRFDLNAQPGLELNQPAVPMPEPQAPSEAPLVSPSVPPTPPTDPGLSLPPVPPAPVSPTPAFPPSDPGLPGNLVPPAPPVDNTAPQGGSPATPPPVPPPMMPSPFLPEAPNNKDDPNNQNNTGTIPNIPL